MTRKFLAYSLPLLVLLLDQGSKIWVKTHLAYGEEIAILGWDRALIHFVENNGMAFGLSFGGAAGKIALTGFRLLAVGLLGYYLGHIIRSGVSRRFLVGFALVLGGAIGNIIDSVFYGVLFSESTYHSGPATFLPEGGGYAPLFFGRVVDMLYLPLAYGVYPEWVPWLGGRAFLFFRPVFNVADVAICTGVVLLLLSYYRTTKPKGHQTKRPLTPPRTGGSPESS